jgi:hypothetical protein
MDIAVELELKGQSHAPIPEVCQVPLQVKNVMYPITQKPKVPCPRPIKVKRTILLRNQVRISTETTMILYVPDVHFIAW